MLGGKQCVHMNAFAIAFLRPSNPNPGPASLTQQRLGSMGSSMSLQAKPTTTASQREAWQRLTL